MDMLNSIFRWLHVFVGILWIGHLYFFNFVNGPFAATMDGETKRKVVPELMPRALFWFRWGALWTWVTGVLLLLLVFYHGGIMFNDGGEWTGTAGFMVALTFAAPFIYDFLAKSGLAKNKRVFGVVSLVLIAVVVFMMARCAHLSYRAYNIHMGALFGTIMAYNVWFRIWPLQQKIITAVKNGEAPNPDNVALAGTRSRHNVYMSLPLMWTMINTHTTYFSGGNFGLTENTAWIALVVITGLSWHIIWHCYNKAAKVKGF